MALNVAATVSDIVSALDGQTETTDETSRWTAVITALYTRIKADLEINSVVNAGQHVSTTGGPTAQTGATDAPGTAKAGGGSGSVV